jgi:orotate phosphoribosyltransferase
MRGDELLALYREEGALLEGHFLLRSGMHSNRYLQSALLLSKPPLAARAGEALAALLSDTGASTVLSPALGGLIIGHEVARALGARFFFAERRGESFLLRRGFEILRGETIAVVEDVVTTGGSVLQVVRLAETCGARVAAVGALVDRSDGRVALGVPFRPVTRLPLEMFPPDACPLCLAGLPIEKPGSRGLHA